MVNIPVIDDEDRLKDFCLNGRTQQQSLFGRRKARTKNGKSCSSKYKGVGWNKHARRWRAKIQLNCKVINLGYYDTQKQAALVYDKAALKLFGEYARTNQMEFPEDFEEKEIAP